MIRRPPSVVFLNGRFLPRSDARISVDDRGLLYGDGLFETLRAYDGRLFAFDEHLERLSVGARRIGLRVPLGSARLRALCGRLLERNGLAEAAVRITLTRGAGGEGLVSPKSLHPTLLVTARQLDRALPELGERGVEVILLPFHRGTDVFPPGAKTIDYISAVVGKTLARRRGAFEGIYSSPNGDLFEGTTSNLFLVEGHRLLTPPATGGILPGVTRSLVLRLAATAGLTVKEGRIRVADLKRAAEAFLTASTIEIMPIRKVVGARVFGPPGPITRLLRTRYANLVQRFALLSA